MPDKLKMFTNEVDFVIAETEEEAKEFVRQAWIGDGSMTDCMEEFDEMVLTVMDMNKSFKFDKEGDGSKIEVKTIQEFIEQYGKGYFASTEY